jgi:cell division protein FtsB
MAVVRARSAPPYALILFVFLWVVSTALAVTFYLSSSRLEEDAAVNQKKFDADTSAKRQTDEQIVSLKKAIGVSPDIVTPQIVAPNSGLVAQALSGAGTAGNLLDAVKSLSNQLADATKTNDAMQSNLKSLQAQVDLDKKNYDAAAGSSNQSSDTFKTQLAAATTAQAASEADKLKAIQDGEKNLADAKDQAEAGRRDNVLLIEQMKE